MPTLNTAPAASWHAGFLNVLPAVRTHARIRFRRLAPERREEAIQEAIASACQSYQLLAAKGRLHAARPGSIATFAVRFVGNGRHVGGRQDAARDVLSPACQRRRGVRVLRIAREQPQRDESEDCATWSDVAVATRRASVPDLAAFRLDFAEWLGTLTRRDRRIIDALASGEGTASVADRFGISPGRVSQLRRRYECDWWRFQGQRDHCSVA